MKESRGITRFLITQPGDESNWTDPKAVSMNARYISMLDMDELLPYVRAELQRSGLWQDAYDAEKKQWFRDTVELIRTRLHTITDFSTRGRPYFADDFEFEEQAIAKNLEERRDALHSFCRGLPMRLPLLAVFDHVTIEQALRDFCESEGIKPGLVINAIRAACTGQTAGPGLFELVARNRAGAHGCAHASCCCESIALMVCDL